MSKTIKYIFTLILFIIAFFMIGMQSLNHFQTFQNQFAKTKIQLPAMNQRADFLKQIITCAIQKQKQILLVPLCLPKGVRTEYIQQNNIDPNIRFFEYEQFQTVCIGSDQNYISSYEINPIVILNDFNSDSSYILYRVSDSEIEQFLEKQESKWKYTAVSASELYEIYREKNVKTAVVFMALIIALIIITVMTVFSTIQLYFSSHKMEMAIRYCHGYHWTRLLAVPIFINGVILFLSSACAFLLSVSLNIDVSKFYWCGILLIMLTDLFTVVLVYHRFIKKSIHQIVKGRTV